MEELEDEDGLEDGLEDMFDLLESKEGELLEKLELAIELDENLELETLLDRDKEF